MVSKKIMFYKFIKYILFFCLFLVLGFAEIDGLQPFAFGMLFALCWCNQKIYIITPLYLISGIIVDCSITSILCLSATCFVFVMFYFLHQKFHKPLNKTLIGLYAFLSQGLYLFLNSQSGEMFFRAVCTVLIGIVCLYAYMFLMQSLLLRGLRRKFLIDEGVCAGILCLVLGIGLCSIPDYFGMISKFLLIMLVIIFFYCFEKGMSFAFSVLLGLGTFLCDNDHIMFVVLSVLSCVMLVVSNSKKIFISFGIVLSDIFVNLYFFGFYDIYLCVPTCLAAFCMLIIPQKTFDKVKNYFICEKEDYCVRDLINRSREQIFKRLYETSVVFKEMQNIYVSMSKEKLNPDDAMFYVLDQTNSSVCKNCSNYHCCPFSQTMQNNDEMKTLISLALARGKISVVDVPSSIMQKCEKIPILINSINSIAKEYYNYSIVSSNINSSRLLVADQLGGVQDVLSSLSKEIKKTISFDISLEQEIVEELMFVGILCSEAFVFLKDENIESVSLNVKTKAVNINKIENIISSLLKIKLKVYDSISSHKPGFSVVILKPLYGYEVVYGVNQKTKWGSEMSGDTFSVIRLGDEKVFLSVCDGMGSGSDAYNISEQSLNLVEKFYEAGFNSNLIIKNVNKLLSLREEESFSALDICVFDLKNASCELIKIGASIGFIKKQEQTILVETSALPLGILDSVKPTTKSFALNDGDMVVMLSDGVVDGWGDVIALKNFINDLDTKNPQVLADAIMEETMQKVKNYVEDDMTVLVGKIWRKI